MRELIRAERRWYKRDGTLLTVISNNRVPPLLLHSFDEGVKPKYSFTSSTMYFARSCAIQLAP